MSVLDQATQRLEDDEPGPGLKPIHWKDMVYKNGNFRVDGRVVFPSGFDYASAPDLARQFKPFIQPLADQLPVTVQDSDGQSAFAVMRRYANLDGRSILLLVNLSADEVDVRLTNPKGEVVCGYDLLNMEVVQGDAAHLSVKGVRLIELDE